MAEWTSFLTVLTCPACGQSVPADRLQSICSCGSPLLATYDLSQVRSRVDRDQLARRPGRLWRWVEVLPVRDPQWVTTLGEGQTPLLELPRLGAALGLPRLAAKDEAGNPTGSFKARGMAVAISRARELGAREFVAPTAGNAGGALAAYARRAGLPAHIFMPKDAPPVNIQECQETGADVRLVDGLISDAGRLAAEEAAAHGWFDVSTLKEPYRVEGKKTMGYELAEEHGWGLPDVILYPTGGGTGLIGMGKAFAELQELGWLESGTHLPRMVAVQAAGCAPVVRAFDTGGEQCEFWAGAHTLAAGLRVPKPFADRLILGTLRASEGTAVAVTDEEIFAAQRDWAEAEGLWTCPEGAATLAAARRLVANGWLRSSDRVVLFNTGTPFKYTHLQSLMATPQSSVSSP